MTTPTEGIICKITNNVILIYKFARLFDGFLIEYNALTQLTLGADCNFEIVSSDVDERDADVRGMICLAGLFGTQE